MARDVADRHVGRDAVRLRVADRRTDEEREDEVGADGARLRGRHAAAGDRLAVQAGGEPGEARREAVHVGAQAADEAGRERDELRRSERAVLRRLRRVLGGARSSEPPLTLRRREPADGRTDGWTTTQSGQVHWEQDWWEVKINIV